MEHEKLNTILKKIVEENPDLACIVEEVRAAVEAEVDLQPEPHDCVMSVEVAIRFLSEKIRQLLSSQHIVVVNIAGGSGSGKSTIARELSNLLAPEATIFSFDSYYWGQEFINDNPNIDWDEPESLDLDLFKEHLSKLANGESVMKPAYSMVDSKRVGEELFNPARVLIVDGLFALIDPIRVHAHITVFVDASTPKRLERRLIRDQEPARAAMSFAETLRFSWKPLSVTHGKYVQPTRKHAQVVISNDV